MNALLLFGEELKTSRQEKQISLTQVAAATRIPVRFLEAIEAGNYSALPQPYIRPFLREYAVVTELNPEETLSKYNAAVQESKPTPAPDEEKPEEAPALAFDQQQRTKLVSLLRRLSMPFAGVAVVVVAVLLLISSGTTGSKPNEPSEVSFDRVVEESEAALAKTQPAMNRPVGGSGSVEVDSLQLEMTTSDSLWIVVVIDEERTEEYLFPPNFHRRWVAREQFSVTMGNAGSATFRLNGKELGTLGKPGVVIRNALITEQTARHL